MTQSGKIDGKDTVTGQEIMANKLLFIFTLMIFVLAVPGCSPEVSATPSPLVPEITAEPLSTATETDPSIVTAAIPSATPTPVPADPMAYPRTRYTLEVDFDYAQHSLAIHQSVSYSNSTGSTLSALPFLIEPNRLGSIQLNQVSLNGQPTQDYSLENDRFDLTLVSPLAPGETLEVGFDYLVFLPVIPPPSDDFKPVPYGYTDRQTNLVDWYFFIPPFSQGDWLIYEPGYYGEFLSYEKADFDVTIHPTGSIQTYTLAASASFQNRDGSYQAVLEDARTFAWSASNQYEVANQQVGNVNVQSVYFPADRLAGQQALRDTADALELYSRLFSVYPHTTLTVVEADFLDGMEYDGLYFLSKGFFNLYDGTRIGYLTAIAVHETSHQWWYGSVGNDQAAEPWLDEAMATYSEHLFLETIGQENLDWWWSTRVNYYEPQGWIDWPIYDYQGFRPYRDAVYLNGAKFLDDLRQTMGEEAFFAFLREYAAQYQDKISTTEDFFSILGKFTTVDLTGLKREYFYSPP